MSLLYMECQLRVRMAYRLSLSLKKSCIFPKQFEFFGNDVCPKGNWPVQSKHQLLQIWPKPEIIRDVTKSLALYNFTANSFITLNSGYCPFVHPLMNKNIPSQYLGTGLMHVSILLIPSKKRSFLIRASSASTIGLIILRTNFLSQGFGYVVCQPGTDAALEAAMVAYCSGSDFAFIRKEFSAVICPVAFGG
jgi:hypothetical protein